MPDGAGGRGGSSGAASAAFAADDVATLVLGVHRSGTSLATAALGAVGCELGALPADGNDENPRGFFEHRALRAFNDRLLARLGASWDNWGFDALETDLAGAAYAADRAAARTLLARDFGGRGTFAIKDPRVSSLLPFWEETFAEAGVAVKRILMLRPPAEVAASQARRAARSPAFHRFLAGPEPMHALWCVTMNTVLASLRDDETLLVGHADLYERPAETLAAMADFLGLSPEASRIEDFAKAFVDPALRRARSPGEGEASGPAAWSRQLFDALSADGLPRRLGRDEALAHARAAVGFPALKPVLPAVFRSLSAPVAEAARDLDRIGRLRRAAHVFGEIAVQEASARTLSERQGEFDTLADAADLDADVLGFRAATLAERLGQSEAAAARFARLAEAAPDFAPAWWGRVRTLRKAGRGEEAESVRAEAAARFPDSPAFRKG